MSAGPRILTEPLGGGSLARLAMAGAAPEAWYAAPPASPADWAEHARRVAASVPDEWLAALRPAFGFGGGEDNPAATRLGRVARAGGIVVTTGQQPGLFGGPVYTWSKAIGALALADAIEQATGIPAAPVFWAATDDADLAEASETWVAVPGGAERLAMRAEAAEGTPMSAVPLPPLDEELAALARGAGSAGDSPVLALVRRAYAEGATVGAAFVALLRGVLEPLGIPVLDSAHPAVQAAARPVLHRALLDGAAVDAALAARDDELARAGHTPQVARVAGRTLVFAWEGGVKRRLGVGEGAAYAGRDDVALSPNVLLRPVVERAILPTVAYLAGPGELAYFAQVSAVADALGCARPLALPRWSTTIVEPHVARILDRLELTLEDLADPHAPERRLARQAMPAALREALDAWRIAAEQGARAVADAGAGLLHERVAEGAAAAMQQRIARVERRALAALGRQESEATRDLATARGALRPGGMRQERALNFLPLLARHGAPLLDGMRAGAAAHASALVGAEATARR